MYKLNSQLLPPNFPREFDAHIYFDEDSTEYAADLRSNAIAHFSGKNVFIGELIPVLVGPHPKPMFEINFPAELFSEVVLWLLEEHDDLSVLVHKLSGDDLKDHTDMAMWMGKQLLLDISRFK
ncbi:MAG: DOPA 4,5-dioxygenase family protein [Bacteriovoracaceae bacterium]|nr:DOPA 4,5-dioxygenase family protein [Bacteriovoracaceae bacterium]